jgi:hypothetical protein
MNFKCYTHVPRREEAQDPQCLLLLVYYHCKLVRKNIYFVTSTAAMD